MVTGTSDRGLGGVKGQSKRGREIGREEGKEEGGRYRIKGGADMMGR